MNFHGLLKIDKATGCTSHDVVSDVRRALRQKKVGHCGTLDPMATGLLLVTAGHATRLTRFLIGAPKVYEGTVSLGVTTDTYDSHGQVVETCEVVDLSDEKIDAEMSFFEGQYEQIAPPYSAKKVDGKKLYELARAGLEVPEKKSQVTVAEFSRLTSLADNGVRFRLACSSGTYARSLVHELGKRLGCGAHLSGLRRTEIGPFTLEGAAPQADLQDFSMGESAPNLDENSAWLPLDEIPLPFPSFTLDARDEQRIQNGQTVLAPKLAAEEGDWIKIANNRRRFVAVGVVSERVAEAGLAVIQPKVVFK